VGELSRTSGFEGRSLEFALGIFYAGEGLMTREAGRRDRDSTAVLGSLDVADLSL